MNDFYWYWLCNIAGIGRGKIRSLTDELGGAAAVYRAEDAELKKVYGITDADCRKIKASKSDTCMYEEYLKLKEKGIRLIHPESDEYPDRLANIPDAPVCLYARGASLNRKEISAAVIGARGCTEYGRQMAYSLGKSFAYMGICVVSGMALGIDAAGQRGCIDGGGMSVGVLGCGVDVCYPRQNIELYQNLADRGCLVSEYTPGTEPRPGLFPERNRIISGLSDVIIVVEARKRSGSLITVDMALEQGKEIMAVPGRVGDPLSVGCNELIKLGAMMITCADDIKQIEAVCEWVKNHAEKINSKDSLSAENTEKFNDSFSESDINPLASEKNMVYSTTNLYPKDMDTIIKETGLDAAAVSRQLLELQLQGAVKEISKNCYVRCGIN